MKKLLNAFLFHTLCGSNKNVFLEKTDTILLACNNIKNRQTLPCNEPKPCGRAIIIPKNESNSKVELFFPYDINQSRLLDI